ncbi:GerAB/ArcD/ProY family transporter [Metabacillus litoralis]|uniref:GerAB/ArcD/ProY family transporter n=1 Tax=Metabacillus litoralis TaxID=152268 RepID=A0A5C6W147_9BACI|nr:GerAB/ArcD/ProY family transporter [Metabacillus litoralis]TXC91574.1 GerAB/ArcD/ProY family transporter [Metabacillus litoralis]
MSKRYIYMMLILNMLTNIVAYVPKMLLEQRTSGSILAILLAVPVGMIIIYLYTKYLSEFPYMGLPEILEKYTSKWFRITYLVAQGSLWFIAGLITLLAFTSISKQFINPDMNELLIISAFLFLIIFGVVMESKKVLFATEIILLVNLPLIAFVIYKSYTNEYMMWESIQIAVTYFWEIPNIQTLSTALFVFSGYANLVIFNRYYKDVKLKYLWLVALLGLITLVTTYFIPIGLHGFDGVASFTYPWIATTDAIRIELWIIERVSILFLGLYINVSLASVILHWHVALEQIKSVVPKLEIKKRNIMPLLIASVFSVVAIIFQLFVEEIFVSSLAKLWLLFLLPAQIIGLLLLKWILKRKDGQS